MRNEKHLEAALVKYVSKQGGLCIKLWPISFTGLPDRLCLFPGGRAVFVELKAPRGKSSKIQINVHAKLKKLGFEVKVIYNISTFDELY